MLKTRLRIITITYIEFVSYVANEDIFMLPIDGLFKIDIIKTFTYGNLIWYIQPSCGRSR